MEDSKDKLESDLMYKSCTTRSDRDAYRICPSKLTKRELEDLYLTLLEDNMEQKKTINIQQERIKMLTTKVQRMISTQKVHQADGRKESCITKCMVNHHTPSILELKRTNEGMAERIRQLNAQLTSARQISKNRLFCVPKCPRMSPASGSYLTDDTSNRSVETQAYLAGDSQVCDENTCKTLMDELKQKIVNLEEELARAHLEYSNRMSRLEIEVSQCCKQDTIARHDSVLIEPGLQQPVASVRADNELAELKNQLVIAKYKVTVLETLLETQLKTAVTSNLVPKTNENQLPSTQPVAKNTNSEEIEIPNRMNDSTPRDANVRQDLAVDNKNTDEPLVSKYIVLPEVEHKDSSGYSKRESIPNDKEYKDKPEVEYNLTSDSTNASINKEYKKKLNTESKQTSGDNIHLDEFHSDKDINNPSVKKDNLLNKNKIENPRFDIEYKTLPGIEYKDLPDEKTHLNMPNVQNYEDTAKVKREEKPDVNRPKYEHATQNMPDVDIGQVLVSSVTSQDQPPCTQPTSLLYTDNTPVQTTSKKVPQDSNTRKVKNVSEIKDDRSQSQLYTMTGPDLIDYNKSLNLDKDQNITEDHVKNDVAPQANTQALKGPSRSQNTDDKSQLIDGTSKLTDNVSQRSNDKSQRIDEKNQCIDIESQRTDDKKQLIDDKSQGQRTNDTSQRTDDKNKISRTSQTWLNGGDRDLHNIFADTKIADTNKQKVQTNNNVTANRPVINSSPTTLAVVQPQFEKKYYVNRCLKCECNAIKVRDTFNSNTNKNFVETMTTDDRNTLNLPNSDISQGLTDTNKTLNVPTYNNRPNMTYTNEVQNRAKPYIEKDRDQTQPGATIIPNLIDTNESRGQTKADMNHKIPTLISQNQTDFNKNKAQTQSNIKKSINPSDTNERHDVTEEDMTRNIRTRQNLPYAKEVKNQTKSNIEKDKNLSQPGAIISSNLPIINESQGLTEVVMTHNTPTYPTSSNITSLNIRTHNTNLDLLPPNEVQNQTNSNIKKIKAQSQPGTNKSPNLTDTHQTQTQIDMIRNNKNLDLPSANGVQQRIDSNLPNDIHQSVPDKNKSPGKLDTNMIQNLPKPNTSNKKQNNKNENISNAGKLQDQNVINMKKDIAQAESDISQELSKADKTLVNAPLDQKRIDSNMETEKKRKKEKENKKIGEVVPYSKDPSTLAKNLSDICEEQQQTIAELERQLDATKDRPRHSDKINLKLGKYFNTDEDDINEMPFSKESKSSKHELTTTKVADQNKTGDDLTSKLPQDNTRESKQKQESSTKPSTNGTKTVIPKNDRHNSLQIPGPLPSTPVQTNDWETNKLRRFSKDGKNNKNTKEASNNTDNEVDKTSTEHEGSDFYVPEKDTVIKTSQTTKKETKFVPKKIGSLHNGLNSPVTELISTQKPDTNGDVPVSTQRELKTYRSKDGSLCFKVKPVLDRSRCCQCNNLLHCEGYNIKGTQPEDNTQLTHSEGTQCMALQQVGYLTTASQNMPAEAPKTPPGSPASPPENQYTRTKTASTSTNVSVTKTNKAPEVLPASAKTPPGSPASPPENQYTRTKTASTSTDVSVTKTNKAPEVLPASATTPVKIPAASSENKPAKTKTVSTSTSVPANTEVVKEVQALPTDAVLNSNNKDIPKEDICTAETTKAQAMQLMEERLQALTAELARYKEMLLGPQTPSVTKYQDVMLDRREQVRVGGDAKHQQYATADCSRKKDTKSVLSELDEEERQLRLKRGVAMHTIGDTYAPRCVFTLHVGTVVLSDEAVQSTRDRSLVLTWKFYNHNASITRMNAGRVMLFDFSSEYDIQITDEFLEYMKFEEMIIAICDLDDQTEPLVTCALPLREALLHTNRRADMSLELVAGPLMIHARNVNHAEDDLDTGDEVGVIDLWCMLRADAKMLPIINKSIAQRSKSSLRKKGLEPRVIQPLIDSDNDSEENVVNEVEPTHSQGKSDQSFQDMRNLHNKNLHRWGSSILTLPSKEYNATSHDKSQENQDREEFYKNERRTSVPKARNSSVSSKSHARKKSISKSQPEMKPEQEQPKTSVDMATQVSYSSLTPQYDPHQYQRRLTEEEEITIDQGQGGILINEVIANIKTPQDMKIAMENTYRNSLHQVSRLPRNEDDIVSQAQSGGSSLGSKTEPKANSSMTHEGDQDLFVLHRLPSDSVSIYKKYDNISKLYSSKLDLKKQVTINANKRNDDNMQDEPQKDEPDGDNSKEEQTVDITILWLALNEECEAMCDPRIQRVYVAYSFLGRSGADLETPFSLPKPKHHVDKCYFNFKKTFQVEEEDMTLLGHMARCRAASRLTTDFKDCIVFSVISEPPEDPLGLDSCEDIGYAFLYLGDLLAYSAGSSGYTEVIPVRSRNGSSVCGVLAVRLDGLDVLRRCAKLTANGYQPIIE